MTEKVHCSYVDHYFVDVRVDVNRKLITDKPRIKSVICSLLSLCCLHSTRRRVASEGHYTLCIYYDV